MKLKKLDSYILKLFIGPFLAILSVLFFLFIVVFFWVKLNEFIAKGLEIGIILKVVFYYGCSLIPLIIPVSILLTSIMVYGSLGEHYELAAIKSTGISLWRAIKPLFILVFFLSISLYFYSDYIVPITQKRLINLIRNIASSQPGLNLKEGIFIDNIPNITMKIDKKIGSKGQDFEGVFIRYSSGDDENQSVIIAKKGSLIPSLDPNYLKMKLFDGFLYKENNSYGEEKKNYDKIKFGVLIEYLDISSLVNQNLEEEFLNDRSSMLNTKQLLEKITLSKKDNKEFIENQKKQIYKFLFNESQKKIKKEEFKDRFFDEKRFDRLKLKEKKDTIKKALFLVKNLKEKIKVYQRDSFERKQTLGIQQFELNKKFALAITCLLMFVLGSPLGSVIRKGGLGLPFILALIIFISYHISSTIFENLAAKTIISPWLGAWIANFILLPIGIWLLLRAIGDKSLKINLFYFFTKSI